MPGFSSTSGLSVSASVETKAMYCPFGATLCAYEQQKRYLQQPQQWNSPSVKPEAGKFVTNMTLLLFYISWSRLQPALGNRIYESSTTNQTETGKWNFSTTYMSDLRPSCFCGRITWQEWESLVSGMGWFIMHIARATFPTFWTCCTQKESRGKGFKWQWS